MKTMKASLAKLLGRARVHEVDVLDDDDDVVLQDNTNLNSAYETATLDYIMTNAVHGTADGCWAGEGSAAAILPARSTRYQTFGGPRPSNGPAAVPFCSVPSCSRACCALRCT